MTQTLDDKGIPQPGQVIMLTRRLARPPAGAAAELDEPLEDKSLYGVPLLVKAVQLPFLVVEVPSGSGLPGQRLIVDWRPETTWTPVAPQYLAAFCRSH